MVSDTFAHGKRLYKTTFERTMSSKISILKTKLLSSLKRTTTTLKNPNYADETSINDRKKQQRPPPYSVPSSATPNYDDNADRKKQQGPPPYSVPPSTTPNYAE